MEFFISMNKQKIIFLFSMFFLFLCASLFYNENREVFALGKKEKCVVDPTIEIRHAEFPKGKIPIGETTDEAELFAQKIIDEGEIIDTQIISMRDEALLMREKARLEIDKAWQLIDLTSPGPNKLQDCVNNCPDVCKSKCIRRLIMPPIPCLWDIDGNPIDWRWRCSCQTCTGSPCPFESINSTYNQINNRYINIENFYNTLKDRPEIISDSKERIIDLVEVRTENLLDDDPNRWKLLNKLLNSRVKLEECITGYRIPLKEAMTKMRVLSCEIAVRKKYRGDLMILGYFEDVLNPVPHCYPYTTDSARPWCEKNPSSLECLNETRNTEDETKNLMDNYFCCEGE